MIILKQLVKIDQYVRNTDINILWKVSNYLSKKYLQILLKNKKRNQKILDNEDSIWLLVQHCDSSPGLQNEYLSIFKVLDCDKCNIAYLEDRVLTNYYGYQRYGTQWTQKELEFLLYPIKGICEIYELNSLDKQALNLRRTQMNLNSIEDYANEIIEFPYYTKFKIQRNEF